MAASAASRRRWPWAGRCPSQRRPASATRRRALKKSRWLRNHWIHGRATGDRPALLHAVRTWTIGLVVLTLPLLAPLVGAAALWAWLALMLHGSLARARYVAFLARAERIDLPPATWLRSPLWFLVDALSWSRSLLDTLWPGRRGLWRAGPGRSPSSPRPSRR